MSTLQNVPSRARDATDEPTDVVLVRWPEERDRAAALAAREQPYLMLVDAGHAPPDSWPELADWIRVPADEADLVFRVTTLRRRAAWRTAPRVDEFDVLWRGEAWVSLPPTQARIMRCLLERPGAVIERSVLGVAGWPGRSHANRSVDVYVGRLRSKVRALGLDIVGVRRRGYVLELCDATM